ncbi:MAG: hypothetical protein FWF81_05060 [Defluviitaleaceae bacterium]|nr:hypothetical protein [Defluviitaleaceae bacterium]
MTKQNLTIPINPDLGNQAQAVFNDMGLDIVTAIDCFLRQAIQDKSSVVVFIGIQNINAKGKPAKLGDWEDNASIADDFNLPRNTPEERRAIVDSLIGSIDDPTFVEPPELDFADDATRNWELMDV